MKTKKWYDYLWIAELLYLALGLTNILFAWLGMLFFSIPLLIALFGGGKAYCNRYCGRGQLIGILGNKLKLSQEMHPLLNFYAANGFARFFNIFYDYVLFNVI